MRQKSTKWQNEDDLVELDNKIYSLIIYEQYNNNEDKDYIKKQIKHLIMEWCLEANISASTEVPVV